MATYIEPPIVTDPDDLAQLSFDAIQEIYSGYVPSPGNPEVIAIEANSRSGAEAATVASQLLTSAYRVFGQKLIRLPPLDATAATVQSTWTMIDDAGHRIPAGTLVNIPASGDTSVTFQTVADVTVMAGSTATDAGAVTLVAVNTGAAGSGLGGDGIDVTPGVVIDFVDTVTLTGITTGGVDAELDDDYDDRLTGYLQLLSPAPLLNADFSQLLLNVAGISRALTIDGYIPAVNEVQTITVTATGGTFTVTFGANTTSALAWNIDAATLQTALRGLASIGAGNVNVTGGPGGTAPFTVTFVGSKAGANQAAMTTSAASLTGGSHSAVVATVTNGAAASTGNAATASSAAIDAAGNGVNSTIKDAGKAYIQSLRETSWTHYMIDPNYTSIDVTFEVSVYAGYDAATVVAAAEQAVTDFLSPANWGLPPTGDVRKWIDTTVIHASDLGAVIKAVQGVFQVPIVTFRITGGSLADTDVTLTGPAALPRPGTISGSEA